uniref:Uncharacterized protein n=1 Tax=Globisporangium ultimum (strain ATCC 200006 / CBS 805.95 / DAOM BR144) TaxID=431595 RepID=K3WLX3_GLOUD
MAPRLSLCSALSVVLLLVAQHQHAHAFSFFGSSPTIDGDSLSWDGDGKTFNPSKAFEDNDKYTQVTLVNWKMDAASNLSIPATVKTL